jgi:hypothetical protein
MEDQRDHPSLRDLRARLASLEADVRQGEHERLERWHARVAGTDYALSAANLAAYLAFRHHDVRDIQDGLATLGLSSLGRLEANVRAGIASVALALDALLGHRSSNGWSGWVDCGQVSAGCSPSGRPRCSGQSAESASPASWSRCPERPPWAATW